MSSSLRYPRGGATPDLTALEAAVAALETDMGAAEAAIATANANIATLTSGLSDTNSDLADALALIAALTLRVDALEQNEFPAPALLRYKSPSALGVLGVGATLVDFELTDATRNSVTLGDGQGRDLRINQTQMVTSGGITQIRGWRHVEWIGGGLNVGGSTDVTAIIPRQCTGIVHLEGLDVGGTGISDAIVIRRDTNTPDQIIQIQNCRVQVNYKGGEHADCFQLQDAQVDELRIDKCTFLTDYQGIFLRNASANAFINQVYLSRLALLGDPGDVGTFLWVTDEDPATGDIPIGPVECIEEVWIEQTASNNPGMDIYPNKNFQDFKVGGGSTNYVNKEGNFVQTDATSQFVRPSKTTDVVPAGGSLSGQQCEDAGWSGIIRIGAKDFAAGDAGVAYVSPGYRD